MQKTYRAAARRSPLALKQVEEVSSLLSEFYSDIIIDVEAIDAYGDNDKSTPISDIEGTDFFTREIDRVVIDGLADFAIHSAKDLPDNMHEELIISAITDSIDIYDVLVSKNGAGLKELRHGATIGTSSKRRKEQLKAFRNDFNIVDIRGNIEERLQLLDENKQVELDAIVIAAAGLIRLGLENRIAERIPLDILKPHPLQGSLAIVTKKENKKIIELFNRLDNRKSDV